MQILNSLTKKVASSQDEWPYNNVANIFCNDYFSSTPKRSTAIYSVDFFMETGKHEDVSRLA